MSVNKCYGSRSQIKLDEAGGYFIRHMMALTAEDLRGKAEIAEELGYRDMVIDRLEAIIEDQKKTLEGNKEYFEAELTKLKQDRWISIDEKWPRDEGQYLIATMVGSMTPKMTIRAGMFKNKGYPRFMTSDWEYVTHWMPLPELPIIREAIQEAIKGS